MYLKNLLKTRMQVVNATPAAIYNGLGNAIATISRAEGYSGSVDRGRVRQRGHRDSSGPSNGRLAPNSSQKLHAGAHVFNPTGPKSGPAPVPIRILNRDSTADEQPTIEAVYLSAYKI